MTNEQHIDNLNKLKSFHNGSYGESINAEQQDDDCISREAVMNTMRMVYRTAFISDNEFMRTIDLLKKLPSIHLKQKTGHWSRKIKVDAYDIAGVKTWGIKCQCDRCDFTTIVVEDFGYYKYCPNCGVKMVEPQERSE